MTTTTDLFRMELRSRHYADALRRRWPKSLLVDPTVPAETKIYARSQQEIADDFEQIGNLLQGLQPEWQSLAPELRSGFLRLQAEYEALRERGRNTEETIEDVA